jgi:hypothetical protein
MADAVLVIDGAAAHDVFEVVELVGDVARVRSPLWFEIGEELRVRVERDGVVAERTARIRAHVGPADARVTELELSSGS